MTQRAHEMARAVLQDQRRAKRLPEDATPTWDRVQRGERIASRAVFAMTPVPRPAKARRRTPDTATTAIDLETYQRRNMTPEQRKSATTERYDGDGSVHGQRYGGKAIARQPLPSRVVRGHMAQLALEARRERRSR